MVAADVQEEQRNKEKRGGDGQERVKEEECGAVPRHGEGLGHMLTTEQAEGGLTGDYYTFFFFFLTKLF